MLLDHDPIRSGSCLDRINRGVATAANRRKMFCAVLALVLVTGCQSRDVEAQAEAANAVAMLEQNRIAEARIAINRALLLRDDVADYHIARGRIELAGGSVSAAFDAYSDALTLDASNIEALQAVAQLGLQTGNINASLKATDTLVLLNPRDTNALVTRGLHALISSRLDEADDYAARALAVNPFSDEAIILRSRVLFLTGKNQDALGLLNKHASERAATTGISLMRLELFRAQREPEGMKAQFDALRTTNQRTWQLDVDEANFLFKVGQRDAALALTVQLLSSAQLSREALRSIMALWNVWAVTDVSPQALAMISENGTEHARYGVALFLARQLALSAAMQVSERLAGNDRDALRAFIAMRSGRNQEAARLAGQILEADRTHCLGLEVQSRIDFSRGNMRAALAKAQELAAQCPDEVAGWIIAAQSYSAMDDPENARRVFRQGAEVNPQDLAYFKEFTRWLRRQDKSREAIAVARRLTRDAPAMVRGWELYRDLCNAAADPCLEEAERGLEDSRTRYWIDYKPGENPPPGLFGRLKEI